MHRNDVMKKYFEMHRLYKNTDKRGIIAQAEAHIFEHKYDEAERVLNQLDSKEVLLEKLLENLRGKSVSDTLQRVLQGKCKNLYEGLKALFSLGTHLCIELEKGRMEYKPLLEDVLSSIHKQLG